MTDPDRIDEAGVPDLSVEGIMALAEIDLAIEEIIRSLDDAVEEWSEEIDRTLVIHHVRMAYIQGQEDRHQTLTSSSV